MTKNNILFIVFSALFFSPTSIHTMLFDSDDEFLRDSTDPFDDDDIERYSKMAESIDKTERDQAFDQLSEALEKRREKHENDPQKWGALVIPTELTQDDRQDARALAKDTHEEKINVLYRYDYPKNRKRIANAILCGEYHEDFVNAAVTHNDAPLVRHLINWRDEIKTANNIDLSTVKVGYLKHSPLFKVASVEVFKLMVEEGKFSIKERSISGETVVHHACHYDRSPNILAYCLSQYPEAINTVDKAGYTPLLSLCKFGLNDVVEHRYRSDALAKLALLNKHGVNFRYIDKNGNTAQSIIQAKITKHQTKDYIVYVDDIAALSTFATRLETALDDQVRQTLLRDYSS